MEFQCKTKIISGAGSLAGLKTLGIRKLFLVTDPYFAQNGTAAKLQQLSGAEQVVLFDKVTPDPTVEQVAEATGKLREQQPDTLIALGGGSSMDLGKAVAYFAGFPLRTVMIPTTSGSGSEVTDFAVLTRENVKYPLVSEALRPAVAILDSDLLESLPKSLIADCGFDVLGHALEAYTAKNANPFTDALAGAAFRRVLEDLPESYAGDLSVRLGIHQASTMAGIAFTQAGLGLCHALAHSLGGLFHLPHGRLIAILLPGVITCNAKLCARRYGELARSAGIPGAANTVAVRNLTNALIRLRKNLNMPSSLKEAGVDPRQVQQQTEHIVQTTLSDPCCRTAPGIPDGEQVRKLLEAVTERG